jgi:hypothetical protein
MADFTGFNPNEITQSIKNMNSCYAELSSIYNSKLKKFVEEVSIYWACPEAKTFFNTEFKTITSNLGRNIENQFVSMNDIMNNAAQAWARTTSAAFTSVGFQNGLIKEVDVSVIKDNINGDIGIDGERVTSLANSFQADLGASIDTVLKKCRNISNGFLGGNQKQALDNKITIVNNSIVENIKDQMSKITINVNSTSQKYQTSAGTVTNSFETESGIATAASGIGSSI